jgi:hypothetical protein
MQMLLEEQEVAEIRKKLLDHDQKFKQLYPIIEELVERVSKLERALAGR